MTVGKVTGKSMEVVLAEVLQARKEICQEEQNAAPSMMEAVQCTQPIAR